MRARNPIPAAPVTSDHRLDIHLSQRDVRRNLRRRPRDRELCGQPNCPAEMVGGASQVPRTHAHTVPCAATATAAIMERMASGGRGEQAALSG